ncbi:MAG: hypothetical protein ACLSHU_02770 [Oscillospiraceae bacterium]
MSYSHPDMPLSQKGKAVSGSLDLASYAETNGNKAVIAVCDYAGNETTLCHQPERRRQLRQPE